MYNWESTVNKRDCENFPNVLKKYKILKVKSVGKTNKIHCCLYNHGFYEAAHSCMFNQPDVNCETHIRGNILNGLKMLQITQNDLEIQYQ